MLVALSMSRPNQHCSTGGHARGSARLTFDTCGQMAVDFGMYTSSFLKYTFLHHDDQSRMYSGSILRSVKTGSDDLA